MADGDRKDGLSNTGQARRQFLVRSGALTGGIAGARYVDAGPPENIADAGAVQAPVTTAPGAGQTARQITLSINKQPCVTVVEPRVTLLDALRENLTLTGTKKGCDRGQCGACTVLINGRRVNSCLTLAVACEGDEITTIEGIAGDTDLAPLQQAFITHDGFQCGYCTSGQICSAVALMSELRAGDASAVTQDLARMPPVPVGDDEIRERMSGNLCRCGAYAGIVAALRATVARA